MKKTKMKGILESQPKDRRKANQVTGQRKAFCRQRIPESTCAGKETVNIEILTVAKKSSKKIMQPIRITSRPPTSSGEQPPERYI